MADIKEMKLAIEKLIEMISSHDNNIRDMQMIQEFQTNKLDKLSRLDALEQRIELLTQTITSFSSRLSSVEARLGLVELDSTSDHQLTMHNHAVVEDWRREHDVGINTDMIPLNKIDIIDRIKKYNENQRRR
jgi:hypothetical protein